jgi:peptidoglycan/xylan/chitin deacetylase (PgdA/CDA1 family)
MNSVKAPFIKIAKKLCGTSSFFTLASMVDGLPLAGKSLLRVLTYHRVDHPNSRPDLDPLLISAVPEQFDFQMKWLSKRFDVVSVDDVLGFVGGCGKLPKRPMLITFDDAYQDFLTHAVPVLKKYSLPSVLFVPTAYPSMLVQSFWWDRLYCGLIASRHVGTITTILGRIALEVATDRLSVFKQLKAALKRLPHEAMLAEVQSIERQTASRGPARAVLTWEELRSVSKAGVTLAPHTHTHPLLDRVSTKQAIEELRTSRQVLEAETGNCPPVFAYPSGHFDDSIVSALEAEQFALAFTTVRGLNKLDVEHPLKLRRNNVGRNTPDGLLLAQMAGIAHSFNKRIPLSYAPPIQLANT